MKTGIKFKPCNVQSAREHNKRDKKYLENVEKSDHKFYDLFHDQTVNNEYWTNPEYLDLSYTKIRDELKVYVKNMTGRAMQEKATPIREGVCPVKPDTTIEDFTPFINWLESHGVSVISIDIHHDEGHVEAETRERKYNHHAHIVCNWIQPNGKSVKMSQADCSTMQTVLAQSLGMERGTPAEETGARHIPHLEYREMKAAENARRLEDKVNLLESEVNDKLQELAEAQEQLQLASSEASKEALKGNLYDIGARVASIFGRGAIAESRNDADEALLRAREAEIKAAEAVVAQERAENAREAAENARKMADKARLAAQQAESRAKEEKAKYGREMYEKGHQKGYSEGHEEGLTEGKDSIYPTLSDKENEIDDLKKSLKELRTSRNEKAETAEKEMSDLIAWNPNLKNWRKSVKDMQTAGLSQEDILMIFAKGSGTVKISKHNIETDVRICSARTAANTTTFGVWFRAKIIDNAWRNVSSFIEKINQHFKKSKGISM